MASIPSFSIPSFSFDVPSFPTFRSLSDLPKLPVCDAVELPSAEDVAGALRDAAYVGVGVAVLTAERVQTVTSGVAKQVGDLVQTGVDQVRAAVSR